MPTCHLKLPKSSTNSPISQGSLQSSHPKITAFLRDAPSAHSAISYQGYILSVGWTATSQLSLHLMDC